MRALAGKVAAVEAPAASAATAPAVEPVSAAERPATTPIVKAAAPVEDARIKGTRRQLEHPQSLERYSDGGTALLSDYLRSQGDEEDADAVDEGVDADTVLELALIFVG
jgi:hypothetical protein